MNNAPDAPHDAHPPDPSQKSWTNFCRRAMELMQRLVPASGAFFCRGGHRSTSRSSCRKVDGISSIVHLGEDATLSDFFALDSRTVATSGRWTFQTSDLYTSEAYRLVPYFRDHSAKEGFVYALIVLLHDAGDLFGVCGLERREGEPGFTNADMAHMNLLAPFLLAAARSQGEASGKPAEESRDVWPMDSDATACAAKRLSMRERETARLLVEGYTVVNITAILGLSEHTVRTYARRLYKKLAVSNRADLVRKFVM